MLILETVSMYEMQSLNCRELFWLKLKRRFARKYRTTNKVSTDPSTLLWGTSAYCLFLFCEKTFLFWNKIIVFIIQNYLNFIKIYLYLTECIIILINISQILSIKFHYKTPYYNDFFFLIMSFITKVLKHVIFQKLTKEVQSKHVVKRTFGFPMKSWKLWPWSQATMRTLKKNVTTLM